MQGFTVLELERSTTACSQPQCATCILEKRVALEQVVPSGDLHFFGLFGSLGDGTDGAPILDETDATILQFGSGEKYVLKTSFFGESSGLDLRTFFWKFVDAVGSVPRCGDPDAAIGCLNKPGDRTVHALPQGVCFEFAAIEHGDTTIQVTGPEAFLFIE